MSCFQNQGGIDQEKERPSNIEDREPDEKLTNPSVNESTWILNATLDLSKSKAPKKPKRSAWITANKVGITVFYTCLCKYASI